MKVNNTHHNQAKEAFNKGMNTLAVCQMLQKLGLTKSQANSACHTARKKMGVYKRLSKQMKEKIKADAEIQASKKTSITQD